jgi:replicative DNA helicase
MGAHNIVKLKPGKSQDVRTAEIMARRLAAERSAVGSALLGGEGPALVIAGLTPEHFTDPALRTVFGAMVDVQAAGRAVDAVTVSERLRDLGQLEGLAGAAGISELILAAPAGHNLPAHISLLQEAHRRRAIHRAFRVAAQQLGDPDEDPAVVVASLQGYVAELDRSAHVAGHDDYEQEGFDLSQRYLSPQEHQGEGIETGLKDLDTAMGPLFPGDFVLAGAKDKTGKSFFALNVARNVARSGRHVAMMALEMLNRDNHARLLAMESGIETKRIRERTFTSRDARDLHEAACRLQGLKLSIYDNRFRLEEIESAVRSLKAQGRLDLLIVDHIHLVQCRGDNEVERTKTAATRLRQLANELGIVVLGLAQFKVSDADNAQNSDKPVARPTRNRLLGGSSIKSLPSHILLLHRPDPNGRKLEVIIDAMRNGDAGHIISFALLADIARMERWSNRE